MGCSFSTWDGFPPSNKGMLLLSVGEDSTEEQVDAVSSADGKLTKTTPGVYISLMDDERHILKSTLDPDLAMEIAASIIKHANGARKRAQPNPSQPS